MNGGFKMKNLFTIPKNAKTTDKSEKGNTFKMDRLFIEFENGNTISIIKGEYSYGGPEGFYEIMPDDSKKRCLENTPLELDCDTVKGWLTIEDVNQYIKILNEGSI